MFSVEQQCQTCGFIERATRQHVHPIPVLHVTSWDIRPHTGPMKLLRWRDLDSSGLQSTSPKEPAMTFDPASLFHGPGIQFHATPAPGNRDWIRDALKTFEQPLIEFENRARRASKTPEQKFRELDVRVGDRIRLTTRLHAAQDASVIEGRILGIKERDGGSQVRVAGFDHTGGGAGGQHVWFPVSQYTVEVLRKSYRWTTDDKIVAEIAGYSESGWEGLDEGARERSRRLHTKRLARIKSALGVSDDGKV